MARELTRSLAQEKGRKRKSGSARYCKEGELHVFPEVSLLIADERRRTPICALKL
jgi:hypothetical protein